MNPYLTRAIDMGPRAFRRLLTQIPESEWDRALGPDRFTVREVIAHLADWEPILRHRLLAGVAEPGCTIEAYDEVQMAADHGYATSDPHVGLDTWTRERDMTAAAFRALTPEDFAKTVVHPENGVMRVDEVAAMIIGHDLYHLEQLTAYF